MSWIELKLKIPEEVLEKISAYLFAMGCEGMNVRTDYVIIYFSQYKWTEEVKKAVFQYIRYFLPLFSEKLIKIKSVKDKNWNQVWQTTFKKLRLTDRIIIKPSWDKYKPTPGEIVVAIDPKMAFGTGHHESTQLVIGNMENIIQPGNSVLDVGTGSGILAIIAEKLGAETITAIDNDPEAIKNAHENVNLNQCKKVKLLTATLEMMYPEQFDVVLANTNRNVLLQYAPIFVLFMELNSKIVLSGILLSDQKLIIDTFQNHGFRLVNKYAKKDWLCLIMELVDKKNEDINKESE